MIGALTDNLVPSIVVEEAEVEDFGNFKPSIHFVIIAFKFLILHECKFLFNHIQ